MSTAAAALLLQLLAAAPAEVPDLAPLAVAARAPATLPAPLEKPDPNKPTWYGWQSFLTDATAGALIGGSLWMRTRPGLETPALALAATGVGTYLLGGPVLHWARGHPSTGLADLGLRLGLPLGGLIAGGFIALLSQQPGWTIPGFGVGVLTAVAVDIGSLSWEPPPGAAPPSDAEVHLAPFLGPARGGAVAGLGGTF